MFILSMNILVENSILIGHICYEVKLYESESRGTHICDL